MPRRAKMTSNHTEDLLRIRINTVDDLEKFPSKKYAAQFIKEGHLKTDDPRYRKKKLLPYWMMAKKRNFFLPKLSFL